eukprot:354617-Chlamydomonas_euryale.AAC.6
MAEQSLNSVKPHGTHALGAAAHRARGSAKWVGREERGICPHNHAEDDVIALLMPHHQPRSRALCPCKPRLC